MSLKEAVKKRVWSVRRRLRIRRLNRVDLARCRELSAQYEIPGGYRRIYFHHIRKTAGTSLNRAFVGLETSDPRAAYESISEMELPRLILGDKVFVGWLPELIRQGYFYYAWTHNRWPRVILPEKTFRITCFRDPVKRVVSHYRMLLDWDKRGVGKADKNRQVDWLGGSFEEFLARMPRQDMLRQLYMFSPDYDLSEAFDRVASLQFVLHTEEFTEGLRQLGEVLGKPLAEHRANRSSSKVELPDAWVERLREMLEPEYRLLDDLRKAGIGVTQKAPAAGGGDSDA